MGQG